MRNPFEILNVTPESSPEEVKRSYRNFVKIYHPDTYQGDKEIATQKMQELNWAFEMLSNPIKRQKYEAEYYENQNNAFNKSKVHFDYECSDDGGDSPDYKADEDKKIENRLKVMTAIVVIITILLLIIVPKSCNSQNDDNSEANSNNSSQASESSAYGDTIVYVTKSGTKYHRRSCGYLFESKKSITLKKAVEHGYSPCSRCNPP